MGATKKAEASDVKKLTIKSNKGGASVDLSSGLVRLEYRESILQETLEVSFVVVETGNSVSGKSPCSDGGGDGGSALKGIIEGLPVVGAEEIELSMEDNNGNAINVKVNVNKASAGTGDNKKNVVAFEATSKEYYVNESVRVVKRYDGTISDSINKILKEVIKTDKKLNIEETLNKYNFIGNSRKPFYTILWLAKKSIPKGENKSGATAGYFFFETYQGFVYKSIDTLLSTKSNKPKRLLYNNSTDIPPGYDGKIIDYLVAGGDGGSPGGLDLQSKLQMGAYGTKQRSFNPYNVEYKDVDKEPEKKKLETAGKELAGDCLPDWLKGLPTREFASVLPIGVLPEGKDAKEQLKKSKEPTDDHAQSITQAPMRYNQLFSSKVEITIPGDFSYKAGDLVDCDFPEQSSKTEQAVSPHLSGVYLICDICHLIEPKKTYTKMNLIRDSNGKKSSESQKSTGSTKPINPGSIGSPGNPTTVQSSKNSLDDELDINKNPITKAERSAAKRGDIINNSGQVIGKIR